MVACLIHNQEVVGSNPTSATNSREASLFFMMFVKGLLVQPFYFEISPLNINNMHIIKSIEVVLYDGRRLHFGVDPAKRVIHGSITVFKERFLDSLSSQLDPKNPPCNCHFNFNH